MPVTAFTLRVKNAGKRRDECGDRGVEEKKASSTIIYNLLHGWLMYVCPQMRNIYFRVHFSMRQTRFNKHSNHKHRHIWYQEHACSPYTVHLHAILEPRHIYEPPKSACMQKKKEKKKRPQQCKRADENKKKAAHEQLCLSINERCRIMHAKKQKC